MYTCRQVLVVGEYVFESESCTWRDATTNVHVYSTSTQHTTAKGSGVGLPGRLMYWWIWGEERGRGEMGKGHGERGRREGGRGTRKAGRWKVLNLTNPSLLPTLSKKKKKNNNKGSIFFIPPPEPHTLTHQFLHPLNVHAVEGFTATVGSSTTQS